MDEMAPIVSDLAVRSPSYSLPLMRCAETSAQNQMASELHSCVT
jgi:hypothetical protein